MASRVRWVNGETLRAFRELPEGMDVYGFYPATFLASTHYGGSGEIIATIQVMRGGKPLFVRMPLTTYQQLPFGDYTADDG